MFASRIFWRIFGWYALLTMGLVLTLGSILADRMERTVVDTFRQRLHDTAEALRDSYEADFPEAPGRELQERLESLAERNQTRLTLVDDAGTVIGDSARAPAEMENHRERPELLMARKNGDGYARRKSPTLGIPMMYYAIRLTPAKRSRGFVRIAVDTSKIDSEVHSAKRLVWTSTAAISFIILVVTWGVLRRIVRPIEELTRAARAITAGRQTPRVDITRRDELGVLAASFNSMSTELGHRIEELQKQRLAISANSQLLETVLSAMTEGVVAVDSNQVVLFANGAARRLLDIDAHDIVGKPIWETARIGPLQQVLEETLRDGTAGRCSLEIPRTKATVALGVVCLSGNSSPGALIVLEDVTELRRLESVRRDFVSNVSHELKTPLTAIQAMSETLLDGGLEDDQHNRGFVERISEQADRLHALILDLLRLSRIEAEPDQLELTPVRVIDVLRRCIDEHRDTANSKNLQLDIDVPDAPLMVLANSEGLTTIFDNLLDNAVKYSSAGGHIVVVATNDGEKIRIEVRDNGLGIPLEHQRRVFERFYRVDRARSRDVGGTGLGLAIVKHWVQLFDGEIELQSEFGHGTEVAIELAKA